MTDVASPAINLRKELQTPRQKRGVLLLPTVQPLRDPSDPASTDGDGTATEFWLPAGMKPFHVLIDGLRQREGESEAWWEIRDQFLCGVKFAVAPGVDAAVDCDPVEV